MKFFISFVMFILFLNGFATAQTLIQDSCKKAAAKDPNLKYDYCVKSLEGNPQSKTANTLEGLLIASTQNAASKTNNLKGIVTNILNSKKYPPGAEVPLRDCLELYTDAYASINEALADVKSHDYREANFKLGAAFDAPDTCETGFNEKKIPSPIKNQTNDLSQEILIPLAFTNMV